MQPTLLPTLLSIAGSDPSGGAGIQADLKTATSIGVFAAAAITCLTVQNSRGVQTIQPLAASLVKDQVAAVLMDHDVSYIKIGMTGTREIVEVLSELLKTFRGEVVLDPVLAASTGEDFFKTDGAELLKKQLLKHISYLTPNRMELEQFTGKSIKNQSEAVECARQLLTEFTGLKGITVKGGHLESKNSEITDFLVMQSGTVTESKRSRIDNMNLHGTGCTYATAFSSYICLGRDPVSAFLQTGSYMDTIIKAGMKQTVSKSCKNGPLLHYLHP